MPSAALIEWRTTRAIRLDDLLGIHATLSGPGPGRRWRTEQINWSTTLRLAGEFQGFARDLHTISVDVFADLASAGNGALRDVVSTALTLNRQLDRGNAQPSSLGADFGRLGLEFWTALAARDGRTPVRQTHLERLNDARNAITHSRPAELRALASVGYPITLRTIRTWRSALSSLATTMDRELSEHLGSLFGRPEPW